MNSEAARQLEPLENPQSLKVLIADDDITNRLVLQGILSKQGFQYFHAENGQQAVEVFEKEQPDFVFMDIMMPLMDGYEATRRIKAMCQSRFVPVIFLTAMTDEQALYKCVQSGGDDFLTKPYNHILLRARMNALLRIRELYNTIQLQNIKISRHQELMEMEARMAKTLFSNIVHAPALKSDYIKFVLDSMSLFNGDMLLVEFKPSGGIRVLLGDFTGHGLAAATGALPASTVFYEMTKRGYSLTELVKEINSRVKRFLPTGMFLAAGVIDLDLESRTISVWNGGLPDIVLFNHKGIKHRFSSHHIPLGVVDDMEFDDTVEMLYLDDQDRVCIYSDGITEATNVNQEMFGQPRLDGIFTASHNPDQVFDAIKQALNGFRAGSDQNDDVTLAEVCFDIDKLSRDLNLLSKVEGASAPAGHWEFKLTLQADVLKSADPLPVVIQAITEIQGLNNRRQQLYTVLAELYSNALEHGLLRLDSSLKITAQGFAEYYQLRQDRLSALEDGKICISVSHQVREGGGRLLIRVEDSGLGFDVEARKNCASLKQNQGHSGRGVPLLDSFCESVTYYGQGNIVEAVYIW